MKTIAIPKPVERTPLETTLPMINIVFLLLVFFMLSGVLVRPERFAVTPIYSQHGAVSELGNTVLLIGAQGQLAMGDGPVTLRELPLLLAQQPKGVKPLQIKADAALPATLLLDVLETLAKSDIAAVQLVTQQANR